MTDYPTAGETCTANQMNEFIGGKHQGGIRYSGSFPDIRRIGVIIGGGADAIYADELHGSTITYIGEGQVAEQKLAMGDRALVWSHFRDCPSTASSMGRDGGRENPGRRQAVAQPRPSSRLS